MLEMRRNAKGVVERLRRGESFRVTYRNRTVGELTPPETRYEISADDPVYRIAEAAEDLGGGLDPREAKHGEARGIMAGLARTKTPLVTTD